MAIIGLDATYLSVSGKGVSRYQYNFIKALSKIDKKNCYYIFLNKKNILPVLPNQENLHYIKIYIPKRIIWDQFQLPLIIKKYKLDIYHSLIDILPVVGQTNFILFLFEIPDYRIELMQQIGYDSLYTKISYKYNKLFFPFSLKKAKIIIASSNSTKKDLIKKYGMNEKKIRVIYPAAEDNFFVANDEDSLFHTKKKHNAEEGYIFHISSSDPRDNTLSVIRAYQKAQRELKISKKLIIYGDIDSEKMGLNKFIRESNLKNSIIFTGRLLEKELVALYQAADLYVDPSLYEGFGFQVVEAMACGIPVITSNMTSLPEVVADAGILVDPKDVNSLASAIVRVVADLELQKSMRKRSLERAKFFCWNKLAQETLAIYDELLLPRPFQHKNLG